MLALQATALPVSSAFPKDYHLGGSACNSQLGPYTDDE